MDPAQLKQAFEWGGWPAVFIGSLIAFGKWYCSKKLEQDKKFHDERIKADTARDAMTGALVNAVLGLIYKTMDNPEAAKVMADISKQHLESVRAATRAESQ